MLAASLLAAALMTAAPAADAAASRRAPNPRVNLEFHEADIRNVIRLLAEKARLNVMMADEVKGQVTLRLRGVPVQDALDAVLRLKGLGSERMGNIVRVAPLAQLRAEAEERLKLQQAEHAQKPLQTRFIPVNYARAEDLLPHVKAVLSDRGTASVDARTKTIIVTDVE